MAIKPLEIITIKMQTPSPEILAKNIIYFCNILRSRGVPIGIDRSLDVIKSLSLDSFKNSNHFYWTLASILIYRADHMKVFEKVFEEFWYQPNHPLTPKKKEEPKKSFRHDSQTSERRSKSDPKIISYNQSEDGPNGQTESGFHSFHG